MKMDLHEKFEGFGQVGTYGWLNTTGVQNARRVLDEHFCQLARLHNTGTVQRRNPCDKAGP